jgi:transcription initiation factor IIF auxiliary subunit
VTIAKPKPKPATRTESQIAKIFAHIKESESEVVEIPEEEWQELTRARTEDLVEEQVKQQSRVDNTNTGARQKKAAAAREKAKRIQEEAERKIKENEADLAFLDQVVADTLSKAKALADI